MLEPSSQTPSLVILSDNAVDTGSELRTIPLLYEYGYENFIYTKGYGKAKLLDYEHIPSEDAEIECLGYPIAHIASQDSIINENEQHLLRKLLQRRSQDDSYIIVTDTNAPFTPEYTKNKSVVDEFTPNMPIEYTQLVQQYVTQHLDSDISISETKNILYHKISEYHKRKGAPSNSLQAIFNFERAPTDSPVWTIPKRLLNVDIEKPSETELAELLSPWTENSLDRVVSRIESLLSDCEYSTKKIENRQKGNPY
ncbi:MAG: hypothetical protein ABEJ83_04815 [Candidatus Nanohaloarchaea archaeon]